MIFLTSGASFGDPHIITFDNVEYTFNGFGEYTVLNVNSTQFILQGRMQPLNGGHNGKSPATVFTAFAMEEKGSSIVEVSYLSLHCTLLTKKKQMLLKQEPIHSCNFMW